MFDLLTFLMHGTVDFLVLLESDLVSLSVAHHLMDLRLHIIKRDLKTNEGGQDGEEGERCTPFVKYLL